MMRMGNWDRRLPEIGLAVLVSAIATIISSPVLFVLAAAPHWNNGLPS
jgi:hypothetical protein